LAADLKRKRIPLSIIISIKHMSYSDDEKHEKNLNLSKICSHSSNKKIQSCQMLAFE